MLNSRFLEGTKNPSLYQGSAILLNQAAGRTGGAGQVRI
jgi:hypothetical protein